MAVLLGHASPIYGLKLLPAEMAVKLFFIISGFYMSLVLSGKYKGGDVLKTFYTNRFLRLYPTYLLGFLLTVGLLIAAEFLPGATERSALTHEFVARATGQPTHLSIPALIAVVIPNLALFGSDIIFLFHYGVASGLQFSFGLPSLAAHGASRTSEYLVVSQMWSVGVELWFYLLVPVLVRARLSIVLAVTAASLVLRLWMDALHPWSTYFFFPTALCFFTAGILAQRFWMSECFKRVADKKPVGAIVAGCLLLFAVREYVPGFRNYPVLTYAIAIAVIPFVFQITKRWEWDRWIGNLSYPVYVFHYAALVILINYTGAASGFAAVAITLALCIPVNLLLEEPLERYRQARLAHPRRKLGPDNTVTAAK